MCHSLTYSTCNVVRIIEEEFVLWEDILYVFGGFCGSKLGFLYGYGCGGYWEWVSSSWRHGIDVLSDAAFHVMMYVSWLVGVVGLGRGIWLCTIGGVGCMYSMIGSVHLSASMSNFWGKNGNVA